MCKAYSISKIRYLGSLGYISGVEHLPRMCKALGFIITPQHTHMDLRNFYLLDI